MAANNYVIYEETQCHCCNGVGKRLTTGWQTIRKQLKDGISRLTDRPPVSVFGGERIVQG